jgi:NAD(P)-dependent dehydrogenase (short-subunit alcohol dehydrogenase family)
VVTGAGSGIGEALALACADVGMNVVTADVEGDLTSKVSDAVRGKGGRALAIQTDVRDRDSVEELARRSYEEFGSCHLLCNNAGVLVVGSLETRSDADWDWLLSVNVRGVINGIQAFLPRMLEQEGERHIVNTASLSGLGHIPAVGAYATSKHAVIGLSEELRFDLEKYGIGVSVFCPGGVATRIFDSQRNRPEELGTSEVSQEDLLALSAGSGGAEEMIAPELAAAAILDGVRRNDAHIITHPQHRDLVEQRFKALMAAFDRAEERALRA